jgi:acyl-CoA reductase-like NAD-dependent aldehyde dehydrogenase
MAVVADVKNSMTIARKEIGPVLCVLAYQNEDDAVLPGRTAVPLIE